MKRLCWQHLYEAKPMQFSTGAAFWIALAEFPHRELQDWLVARIVARLAFQGATTTTSSSAATAASTSTAFTAATTAASLAAAAALAAATLAPRAAFFKLLTFLAHVGFVFLAHAFCSPPTVL
jgi:hypothetical protein